jgi:predicted ArsR family transcriptional regulator
MASHRVSGEITIMGRRILRHYVEHAARIPLRQTVIAGRLRITKESVRHHVVWLVNGGYLEPIPGSPWVYRATAVGRQEIRTPSRRVSATGRARRVCYCPQCRAKIPVE